MEYFVVMFLVGCFTVGFIRVVVCVACKAVDVIVPLVFAKLERQEWHRIVMRNLRRKRQMIRKENWKRELMAVALNFSLPARLAEENEKRSDQGA